MCIVSKHPCVNPACYIWVSLLYLFCVLLCSKKHELLDAALALTAVTCRCFVVGKDVPKGLVYVTDGEAGPDHPALLSNTALLHSPQWVAGDAPEQLLNGLPLPCSFRARSAWPCFAS